MNPRSSLCQLVQLTVAMSAATASLVLASPAHADEAIVVQPDSYVFDGRTYGDLESLTRALPTHDGVLALGACMPGSSRSLTAAVQRLADRPLEILVLDASSPACGQAAPAMVPVALRTGDDATSVQRYWMELAP